MCCSKAVSKCLLIIFNVGFLLLGGVSLGMGVFILYDKDQILAVLGRVPFGGDNIEDVIDKTSVLESSAYVLIVAGGIVFGISFLGFCGACKMKVPFLYGYIACVVIVLLLELAAGIMGYLYKDNIDKNLKKFLKTTIKRYYKGATFKNGEIDALSEAGKPVSVAWDFAQYYFQCCGADGYEDFHTLPAKEWDNYYNYTDSDGFHQEINGSVPVTCCKIDKKKTEFPNKFEFQNITGCLLTADSEYTNHKGCYKPLKNMYTRYTLIIGGVGVGIAIIEIVGILAACCLIRQIKKDKQ